MHFGRAEFGGYRAGPGAVSCCWMGTFFVIVSCVVHGYMSFCHKEFLQEMHGWFSRFSVHGMQGTKSTGFWAQLVLRRPRHNGLHMRASPGPEQNLLDGNGGCTHYCVTEGAKTANEFVKYSLDRRVSRTMF